MKVNKKSIFAAVAVLLLAAALFVGAGAAAQTHQISTGAELVNLIAGSTAEVETGDTIELTADITCPGMKVTTGKNFTLDFKGHTLTIEKPGAGSTNTQTSGFQLIQGSTIVFTSTDGVGMITIAAGNENLDLDPATKCIPGTDKKPIKMLIQNYANLTLNNIVLDATHISHKYVDAGVVKNDAVRYAVSINHGTVGMTGTTGITAVAGDVAFDVCNNAKYDEPNVTVNTDGTITGKIEYSLKNNPGEKEEGVPKSAGSFTIEKGTFVGDIVNASGDAVPSNEKLKINGGDFTVSSPEAKALIKNYDTTGTIDPKVGQNTVLTLEVGESYVLAIPSGLNFVKDASGNYVASYENAGVTDIAIGNDRQVEVTVSSQNTWTLQPGDIAYTAKWGSDDMDDDDYKFIAPHDATDAKKVAKMEFTVLSTAAKIGTNTDTLTFSASIEDETP